MMFDKLSNYPSKCVVAGHIKYSILHVKYRKEQVNVWVLNHYPYPLTYLRSDDAVCLFYVKNDSIIYYYKESSKNKDDLNILPLYNYLSESYDIIQVKYRPHIFAIEEKIIVVKSPNGKFYGLVEEQNVIYIFDLVENKILYEQKITYSDWGQSVKYSPPIANSLVVVVKVDERKMLLTIDIFDLVKEDKYEIKYSLRKHKQFLLEHTFDDLKQKNWLRSQLTTNSIDSSIKEIERNVDKLNDKTVFYRKVVFAIDFRYLGEDVSATQKVYRYIRRSPIITAEYKEGKLVVSIETSTDGIIEIDSTIIQIKPNVILDTKEYILDDEHRVLNSHLYSVIASLGEYKIIKEIMRQPIDDKYIHDLHVYYKGKSIYSTELTKYMRMAKISGIHFIKTENGWLAFATKSQLRTKYDMKDYVFFRTQYLLHITDIKKIYNELNNLSEYSIFTNVSHLVMEINIIDEIKKLLSNLSAFSYRVDLRNAEYYFDIKLGLIYIMFPVYGPSGEYFVMIFRNKVDRSLKSRRHPSSIWYLKPNEERIHEMSNKAFLFCNVCFYYLSGLGDFNKMSENKLFTQHGIMPIRLRRNTDWKNYYDVGYNRLSVSLRIDHNNSSLLICDLIVSKKLSYIIG